MTFGAIFPMCARRAVALKIQSSIPRDHTMNSPHRPHIEMRINAVDHNLRGLRANSDGEKQRDRLVPHNAAMPTMQQARGCGEAALRARCRPPGSGVGWGGGMTFGAGGHNFRRASEVYESLPGEGLT